MTSASLQIVAWISLAAAAACALVIGLHLAAGHRQHMWIMNLVWPITALYSGPLGLWAYFRWGKLSSHACMMQAKQHGGEPSAKTKPFWQTVLTATTHCGAGCTTGDILAESLLLAFPFTLFGRPIFAAWLLDYAAALLFGFAVQYFTIKPMRQLAPGAALKAAIKADFFSLTAWQIGMYAWMAIVTFLLFGHELTKTTPVFWFEMQIAMLCGLLTSYPVNAGLLRAGIKEKM